MERRITEYFSKKAALYFSLFISCISLQGSNLAWAVNILELCPHFVILGELNPGLSQVEKRLICGDPEKENRPPNEGWRKIPFQQAKFYLTNFLQDRGYYHPYFDLTATDPPEIRVELGEKSRVTKVLVEPFRGLQETSIDELPIHLERKRDLVGEVLTPAFLNELEKWVTERLQIAGYACPQVKSSANSNTGEVKLRIDPGLRQKIREVTEEPIPRIEPRLLRRYDAFEIDNWFDSRLLTLTENRNAAQGVVEALRFRKECSPLGVTLKQETLAGLPRLMTVGMGANTEGVLLGKFSWKNTRLDPKGSLFDFSVLASARIQSLQANMYWYTRPTVTRSFFNPLVLLSHREEQQFESMLFKGRFAYGNTWDYGGDGGGDTFGGQFLFGPSLEYFRTLRGKGSPLSQFLSWDTQVQLKSHLFEYYQSQPQTGFFTSLTLSLSDRHIISAATAQRVEWLGQNLWNLFQLDPPLWIIGVRWGVYATLTSENTGFGTQLPANFFKFLGGSSDLRGFSRQELPSDGRGGGLTSGFVGLEARMNRVLPWGLDPFLFVDGGAVGQNSWELDQPFYWSPGFGLRWASPIGPVRATLGHGFTGRVKNHLQLYLSLGEEF